MKKILEHYANAVIAMMVAFGIFGIFYGLSFSNTLKDAITTIIFTNTSTLKTGNAFDSYAKQISPNFIILNDKEIEIGERIPISSIVKAVNPNGEELEVLLKNSWDENFQSTNSIEILDKNHLYFHEAGVFWVELYALNSNGYDRCAVVQIFANER